MIRHERRYDRLMLHLDGTWENRTIKDFFDLYKISKKNRYIYLQNEIVLLNRKKIDSEDTPLHKKDCITILINQEEPGFKCNEKECKVIYEDDFVYVVSKPADLIIHGDPDDTNCLASMAATWQVNHNLHTPVRYIHRLDKDTRGLVLFVKIPFFQPFYDALLEEKKIFRHYYAITTGSAKLNQKFSFQEPIGKDRHVNGKYRVSETGKPASTKAVVVGKKDSYLLMSCEIETGRTHQIRVHLSNSQHPIINDPLYGVGSLDFSGMCLWADRIVFKHALTMEDVCVNDEFNPLFDMFEKEIKKDKSFQ